MVKCINFRGALLIPYTEHSGEWIQPEGKGWFGVLPAIMGRSAILHTKNTGHRNPFIDYRTQGIPITYS